MQEQKRSERKAGAGGAAVPRCGQHLGGESAQLQAVESLYYNLQKRVEDTNETRIYSPSFSTLIIYDAQSEITKASKNKMHIMHHMYKPFAGAARWPRLNFQLRGTSTRCSHSAT